MSVVPVVSKTLLSVCPASSLSSTTSVGRAGLSVWISSTSSATAPLSHKYTHTPIVWLLSYFKTTRKFLQHRHGGNRVCSMSLSEATSAHGLLEFVTLEWSDYLPEDNNPNYSPYPVHSTATVTCLLNLQSFQMYRLRSLLSPLNEWVGQRASRDPLVIASVGMKRN